MKRVTVAIELTSDFIKMLNASCGLKHLGALRDDYVQHTAIDALAIAVLLEARGAKEEEVDANIPHEWRSGISVVHESRRVVDDSE